MSDLVEPLVPAGCDLRDFAFLPLEGRRLLTSDTWILGTHEERCAALCLWIEAWHQVPAASLPNNDRLLAHLSLTGARWPKVKAHALRGWVKASDGKLYHPVLAEKALDAWARKQSQRDRTAAARAARLQRAQQHGVAASATTPATSSVTENVTSSKGQGQGHGQGIETPTPLSGGGAPDDARKVEDCTAKKRQQAHAIATQTIEYLNAKAGTSYRGKGAHVALILARVQRDGADEAQLRAVIDSKVAEWAGDPERRKWLSPDTLFNATKYAKYVGQLELARAKPAPLRVRVFADRGDGSELELVVEYDSNGAGPEEAARELLAAHSKRFDEVRAKNIVLDNGRTALTFSIAELRA